MIWLTKLLNSPRRISGFSWRFTAAHFTPSKRLAEKERGAKEHVITKKLVACYSPIRMMGWKCCAALPPAGDSHEGFAYCDVISAPPPNGWQLAINRQWSLERPC